MEKYNLTQSIWDYVEGTSWKVSSITDGKIESPHSVPWVFSSEESSVEASGYWIGVWSQKRTDPYNKIRMITILKDGSIDSFELFFLSERLFVGYKNDDVYKIGKLIESCLQ